MILKRTLSCVKASASRSLLAFQFWYAHAGRRKRHKILTEASVASAREKYPAILESLDRDGFALLKGAVNPHEVLKVKPEMDRVIQEGKHLLPVSRDSVRKKGELGGPKELISIEEISQGEGYLRTLTNQVSIADPLLHCRSILPLAFSDLLLDIACGYLGCFPGLGTLNLRRSYINDLPELDTNYFHSDANSAKFLKAFFYLNDVDLAGGPFSYVRGSRNQKFPGWTSKYRWTEDEIVGVYGRDRLVSLTASVGDVLLADTTGFHRGTKVQSKDRSMLTLDYLVHKEETVFNIAASDHLPLSPKQKAAAEFLRVV